MRGITFFNDASGGCPGLVLSALLWLRGALLRLADAVVPARLSVYELTTGIAHTQIVSALVELGVPQALSRRPQTVQALAERTGVPAASLLRLLRAAAALNLVRACRRRGFAANRRTTALLPQVWGSMAPFGRYMASEANVLAWAHLPAVIRGHGDAFAQRFGSSVWDYFASHPQDAAVFNRAMVALTEADAPAIAQAFDFARFACICEVGCGQGTLLIEVLRRYAAPTGILFDRAEVLQQARAYPPRQLVAHRVREHAGDFFRAVPQGADLVVLRHVLHDWDDSACLTILRNCRRAMQPGHSLLLIDTCLDGQAHRVDSLAARKDLTMAVLCGGQERSATHIQQLLQASGFVYCRRWPVWAPVALWEARAT